MSWHVLHLDNCFDICHTSLNWQMLLRPPPANKSQHKLQHRTFYTGFMGAEETVQNSLLRNKMLNFCVIVTLNVRRGSVTNKCNTDNSLWWRMLFRGVRLWAAWSLEDLFMLPPMSRCHEDDWGWHDTLFLMSRDRFPGPVLTHFNTRSKYEDNMTHPELPLPRPPSHVLPESHGASTDQNLIKCWLVWY